MHGTNVEDGAFQGYLKTMGIPFVGCDVTASAIGMDKYLSLIHIFSAQEEVPPSMKKL